jgi:hypothetical protein
MKINHYIKIGCLLAATFLWAACEKEASMTGITVDKESLSLLLGNNAQITVNPIPADIDVDTRTYEWSSDNEAIATVTQFGIVRTTGEGSCNITVRQGSFSQTIPVTVTDPVVVPAKKAQWKFDGTDPTIATIGQPLVYGKNGENPTTDLSGFGAITGPTNDNKAIRVKKGYFFVAQHGITASGGLSYIQDYTFMIDFRIPAKGSWYSFYQTDMANGSDAEIFINTGGSIGVGATGYSATQVEANVWTRFVITVASGSINFYLNGGNIHSSGTADERFRLDLQKLIFFGDNDGDDADMDVAEVAIWSEVLDADQVRKLERTESKLR